MNILRQINLSNIRRFGKDVDIPLSPQATIILAPNGTGKTALFEAIELALTGTVARLLPNRDLYNKENLLALIRDTESEAKVSLLFDESEYFAEINSSGEVKWTAPDWFYGNSNSKDVGYLLRLTHLLDQRDRYWFVQETSEEAGSLISKLPIGKEALYIFEVLPGLKRSITKMIESKKQLLKIKTNELDEWNKLLLDRNAIREKLGNSFFTFDQIVQDPILNRKFDFELDSIDKVAMAHGLCFSDFNLELENSKKYLSKMHMLESNFNEYKYNFEESKRFEILKNNEIENIKFIKDNIESLLDSVDKNIKRYTFENNIYVSDVSFLNQYKEYESVLESLKENASLLKEENDNLVQLRRIYEEEKSNVERNRYLRNEYEIWNVKSGDIQKRIKEYDESKNNLFIWYDLEAEKKSRDQTIIELRNVNLEHENILNLIIRELTSSEEQASEVGNQLESLKQANDKVKASIAEIAANISENQNDCPLCGIHHGLEELKKRMAEKLNAMDPALLMLTEYEKDCQNKVKKNKQEYESALLKFNLSREYLHQESLKLSDVEKSISKISQLPEFNLLGINEAIEKFKEIKIKIDTDKNLLDDELKRLQPIISNEEFLEYRQKFEFAEEKLLASEKFVKNIEELQVSLNNKKDSLINDLDLNGINVNLSSMEEKVKNQKNILDDIQKNNNILKNKIEIETNNLKLAQFKLDVNKSELEAVISKTIEYKESWNELGFNSEPTATVLDDKIVKQLEKISKIEKQLFRLDEVRKQIAYLRASDAQRIIQDKIDALRNNMSEIDFQTQLEHEQSKGMEEIDFYQEKGSIVETFTELLKDEIKAIQNQVAEIQPLWRSLLKRIVREARFSQTGLELNRRYNKSHAQVQVQVSGRNTPASFVASEAQKTDLQLTFLLSMALVHQWSPWRGLLLDDPTQHHDLVHASAVYDVLRDYISEYGFQIIITTHDPVQARYFLRKLKNDDINTQLVSLVPTVGGVTAQVIN